MSARATAPISGRPSQPGLNEAWFAAPPPTVPRLRDELEPVGHERPRRKGAGGAVAALLVAAVLGGTVYLWKNNQLPEWSGTAPPSDEGKMEPVSHTELTSALVDTTLMTPPAALEKNQADNGREQTNPAPATAMPAESTETPTTPKTEEPSPKAPMDTQPAQPSAPSYGSKAKTAPTTTTDDTMPAKPWAGTSTPRATPRPSSTTDDTTPGGMSPTPAPSAPDTTGTGAPSPTTEPTTSPSSPTTPPATDSPGF